MSFDVLYHYFGKNPKINGGYDIAWNQYMNTVGITDEDITNIDLSDLIEPTKIVGSASPDQYTAIVIGNNNIPQRVKETNDNNGKLISHLAPKLSDISLIEFDKSNESGELNIFDLIDVNENDSEGNNSKSSEDTDITNLI